MRTLLRPKFPGNREKYKELGLKSGLISPAQICIYLVSRNLRQLGLQTSRTRTGNYLEPNRESVSRYRGVEI